MMDDRYLFSDFDGSLTHFKANPPEGGRVELELSDVEIQHIAEQAVKYDCTIDVFLTAVVACWYGEMQSRAAVWEDLKPELAPAMLADDSQFVTVSAEDVIKRNKSR